jgi:hypothetical protein
LEALEVIHVKYLESVNAPQPESEAIARQIAKLGYIIPAHRRLDGNDFGTVKIAHEPGPCPVTGLSPALL